MLRCRRHLVCGEGGRGPRTGGNSDRIPLITMWTSSERREHSSERKNQQQRVDSRRTRAHHYRQGWDQWQLVEGIGHILRGDGYPSFPDGDQEVPSGTQRRSLVQVSVCLCCLRGGEGWLGRD